MKNLILCLSVFAVLLTACRAPQTRTPRALSAEQEALIDKYVRFKLKITLGLGLDQKADWDRDIRPKLAVELGFPREAPWNRILSHPQVRELLTPEKQQAYRDAFNLPVSAEWPEIKDAVKKSMETQ